MRDEYNKYLNTIQKTSFEFNIRSGNDPVTSVSLHFPLWKSMKFDFSYTIDLSECDEEDEKYFRKVGYALGFHDHQIIRAYTPPQTHFWQTEPTYKIHHEIRLIETKKLKLVDDDAFLSFVKLHLATQYGCLHVDDDVSGSITLLQDGAMSKQRKTVWYFVKNEQDDETCQYTLGVYLFLNESIVVWTKVSPELPADTHEDDVLTLLNIMKPHLFVEGSVDTHKDSHACKADPIIQSTEHIRWSALKEVQRYAIEQELLKAGVVNKGDCYYVFTDECLEENASLIFENLEEINYHSDEVVVPELNFDNFVGTIQVPAMKNINCQVSSEIQRRMDEQASTMRCFSKQYGLDV